ARTTANGSLAVGVAAGGAAGPHATVQQHSSRPTPTQAATDRTTRISANVLPAQSTAPPNFATKTLRDTLQTNASRHLEVDGSRWASPSSKRLLGQLPGRGWVRLPCTSAT